MFDIIMITILPFLGKRLSLPHRLSKFGEYSDNTISHNNSQLRIIHFKVNSKYESNQCDGNGNWRIQDGNKLKLKLMKLLSLFLNQENIIQFKYH